MAVVVTVRFTGSRLTLFPYIAEQGVVEEIQWLTNVMRSRDQTEQRHSLRQRPRQVVEFQIAPEDTEDSQTIRNLMFSSQALLLGILLPWDQRDITNTAELAIGTTVIPCNPDNAMFSAGGQAVIILPDGTGFDVSIDTVQSDASVTLDQGVPNAVPVGSLIFPLATAFIDNTPRFDDFRVNFQQTRLRFLSTSSDALEFSQAEFDASDFSKHPDGRLVLDTPNAVRQRFRHTMNFERERTDSGIGDIAQFPTMVAGEPVRPVTRTLRDVAEIWQFKKLLYYLRGSWRSFYLPTFNNDFTFSNATYDLSDLGIIVQAAGFTTAGAQAPHRDVYLQHTDGRTFTRRVSSIADNGDGTETITLATAFAASEVVNTSDLVLSWAELVRIDGDSVAFNHERVGKAEARFSVRGVVEA